MRLYLHNVYPSVHPINEDSKCPSNYGQGNQIKKKVNKTIHNFTSQKCLCFAQLLEGVYALLQTVRPIHRPPLPLTVTNKIHENSKIKSSYLYL
jgi:hypothetical protein